MAKLENYFDECLFFSANSLSRSINKISEIEFNKIWLSSSYGFVLMIISEKDKISTWEIAKVMNMDSSTITRFLDKLILLGYIEKKAIWRQTEISLTTKWKNIKSEIQKAWKRVFKKYKEVLWDELSEILTKNIAKANKTFLD